MKLKSIALATLLAMGVNVQAADFSYSNLELGFSQVEWDVGPVGIDGDQISLEGNVALGETFYLTGGYDTIDYDYDIDMSMLSLGVGAHASIGEKTDLFGEVALVQADVEFDGESADENGNSITVGLRHMATDKLEVFGGVERTDIDGSSTGFFVGVSYSVNETIDLGASLSDGDGVSGEGDLSGLGVALRINF